MNKNTKFVFLVSPLIALVAILIGIVSYMISEQLLVFSMEYSFWFSDKYHSMNGFGRIVFIFPYLLFVVVFPFLAVVIVPAVLAVGIGYVGTIFRHREFLDIRSGWVIVEYISMLCVWSGYVWMSYGRIQESMWLIYGAYIAVLVVMLLCVRWGYRYAKDNFVNTPSDQIMDT